MSCHVRKNAGQSEVLARYLICDFALHICHSPHLLEQNFEITDLGPVLFLDPRFVRDQVSIFLIRSVYFLIHGIASIAQVRRTHSEVDNYRPAVLLVRNAGHCFFAVELIKSDGGGLLARVGDKLTPEGFYVVFP